MTDNEPQRIGELPVSIFRITPLDTSSTPQHASAETYDVTHPLALCLTADCDHSTPTRFSFTAALIADADHSDTHGMFTLARVLWRLRYQGAAVEAWAALNPGQWLYSLLPAWIDQADTGQWADGEPAHRRVLAVGRLRSADTYTWADPAPIPDPPPLYPDTYYMTVLTPVPPPAIGHPAPT